MKIRGALAMRNVGLQPQFDSNSDLTRKQWGLTSKWSCSSANVLFSDMWISANISPERLVIKRNHNHLVALLRKSSTRYLWHGKPTIILTPICRWHMFFLLTKKDTIYSVIYVGYHGLCQCEEFSGLTPWYPAECLLMIYAESAVCFIRRFWQW